MNKSAARKEIRIKLVFFQKKKKRGKQALKLKHTSREIAIYSHPLYYTLGIAKAKASLKQPVALLLICTQPVPSHTNSLFYHSYIDSKFLLVY